MPVRILIVDDSSLVRNLLRQALESQTDWQICGEAANGKEGIDLAQTTSPDLIILDLSMPVVNGLDAARILHQQMPNIPLIMFTTFCTVHLEREALLAGVTKIISKTGPLSDLIEGVRSLLKHAA